MSYTCLPFAYLLGTWSLERRLVDHRLGLEGRFEGVARVEERGEGEARYHEEGLLEWPGHRGPAWRSLTCRAAGERAVLFEFADGRPFHRLELTGDGYEVEHRCGGDCYTGRFVLVDDEEWRATWVVEGPRKSLVLDAAYQRLGAAPGAPS